MGRRKRRWRKWRERQRSINPIIGTLVAWIDSEGNYVEEKEIRSRS